MPNKKSKEKKRKRLKLNAQLKKQGRTAKQYKRYVKKQQQKGK
tara:strand:- start:241 stop:369 length:129 start_codon:yes stop_codon:yes gene_type:complete